MGLISRLYEEEKKKQTSPKKPNPLSSHNRKGNTKGTNYIPGGKSGGMGEGKKSGMMR